MAFLLAPLLSLLRLQTLLLPLLQALALVLPRQLVQASPQLLVQVPLTLQALAHPLQLVKAHHQPQA